MKKYLMTFLIVSMISGVSFSEELENSPVVNPQDVIFRSSLTDIVHDLNDTSDEYIDDRDFKEIDSYNMPFVKQMRLRLSNKYLEFTTKPKKWQYKKKNIKAQDEDVSQDSGSVVTSAVDNELNSKNDVLSLEGAINTEVTEKQLMLDAQTVSFDDETGDMVANGRPVLVVPPQNMTVISDKMVYSEDGNILKAIGNVIVLKDNKPIHTDYLEINMNEETMIMDNIVSKLSLMDLKAEKAIQQDGLIVLNNGVLYSENPNVYRIESRMAGPRFQDMLTDSDVESLFFGNPEGNKLNIHVKSIELDARKNHDVVKMKNIEIEKSNAKFFKWPSLTVYTNKNHDYFEGNYPEFGSKRKVGLFAGPGFAFGGPLGSVVKVVPFVNYKSSDFGIGGMLKYVNTYNRTELGYASAKDIFFLKGKQRLDDNLYLHYAYNSYTNEWFLGGRMPKYIAEIYYDKSHYNKNFLGEGKDLTFRHRASFGFMKDDDRNYNGEKFADSGNMSTTRTRYMAELNQSLYRYKNEEKKTFVDAGLLLQGSAALYGTGDTQFVARVGPRVRFQYKNWMQDIGYLLTGYDDQSPLPRFDAYRYGKSSVYLTEAFRITKYLSVGWSGNINLSDDAPNGKTFQENAFLVSIGPDDFRIVLGYDFIRDRTYLGFNLAFDPKGTNISYDKMIIKNPEKLGQSDDEGEERTVAFNPAKDTSQDQNERKLFNRSNSSEPKILQYAQVIELEDPEKERID